MNILITGGAGYIGSAICNQFTGTEHNIEVYDTFDDSAAYITKYFNEINFKFVRGDVRDKKKLSDSVKRNDVIVHLAAIVGFPACDRYPIEANSINVDATSNICNMVGEYQKLIFASTGSTYGKISEICDENTPINPLTLYGKTKAQGEEFVNSLNSGINLRLATLYGISGKVRTDLLINNFMKDAVLNKVITVFQGSAMRTFLEVNEAAKIFKHFIINDTLTSGTYNVGSNKYNYSKIEIAQLISKLTGAFIFSDDYNSDPDCRDYNVSYKKLELLGINSAIDFMSSLLSLKHFYEVN